MAYNGDWCEGSKKWKDVPENLIPPQGTGNAAEGIFWIAIEDFLRLYFINFKIIEKKEILVIK